jgi:TRAP-type C4-dicarboxylate transport system permease small subunit
MRLQAAGAIATPCIRTKPCKGRKDVYSFAESLKKALQRVAIFAGWILLALCVFIVVATVLRKFFDISIQGANEYGGYLLAVSMGLGFAYAVLDRAHIRITIVRDMFSDKVKSALDLFAMAVLTVFAANITHSAFAVFSTSWRMSARATSALQTPLSIPQSLWMLSLLFFTLTCAALAVNGAIAFARKDWRFVDTFLGTRSTDEEIKEELREIPSVETQAGRA